MHTPVEWAYCTDEHVSVLLQSQEVDNANKNRAAIVVESLLMN